MVPRIQGGSAFVRHASLALLLTLGAAPVTAQALNSTTALSLRDRLDSLDSATELIAEQEAIRKFYEERTFAPLWFTPDGPTDAARRVMRELEQADSWGLRVDDFALSEAARADGPRDDDQLAAAEFELSTLVLKYARHASGGRISEPERQLSDYIDRRAEVPSPADVLKQLAQAAAPEDVLRSYHPQHDQFQRLRALYVKLRGPADAAKFVIARTGKLLAPGDTSPEIEALRGRLGVPATAGNADVYDAPLLAAVKAFQRANRLSADGYVGPRTRAAFQRGDNQAQIRQILVSMEQWRWMPRDLGQRHALVNIPAYSIDFVEGGKSVMNERVIVGRPDTPTPVFSKPMSTIVLKPSWILPDSIKREKLLRGRSLEGQGLVVKKGDRIVKAGPSTGRKPISRTTQSTSRRATAMHWAASSSCSPTSTRSTCTTRRTNRCSPPPNAPTATAASGCAILSRWRSSYSIGTRGRAWWTSNGSSLATGPTTTRLR